MTFLTVAGCSAEDGKKFHAKNAGFTILLPHTPEENIKTSDTPNGQMTLYFYSAKKEPLSFSIVVSVLPEEAVKESTTTPERLVSSAMEGVKKKGKLRSEKQITLDGHPGSDYILESPDGRVLHGRFYQVGKGRSYHIMAVTPHDREPETAADVKRYLESFKLKK